jgi:hypothetical protein
MFQLAAPLGLLALGALLAPILIHLVRRPQRVVKVGSLRPLQDARRQIRSFRWHDPLLLVLRCAVLAALALSLAGLRWQPPAPASAKWLLLLPGTTLDSGARAEWDQLRNDGFDPRSLFNGFPRRSIDEPTPAIPIDAWSLLRELDHRLPAGSRAVVFGPTTSSLFQGERPTLANVNVTWRVTSATATPGAAPSPPRVALLAAADREVDARYLRAALTAAEATIVTDGPLDWIFQLGDVELPVAWHDRIKMGARLVTDAPDTARAESVARWFDAGTHRVRITRRVTLDAGAPLWRDSVGDPFVTEARKGAGAHWRFAVRFHPDWSDWPVESAFPRWWRDQLHRVPSMSFSLAPEQAAPRFTPGAAPATLAIGGFGRVDLRAWSWLLAAVLFAAERVLSWQVQQRKVLA